MIISSSEELRAAAERRRPRFLFDYIDVGSFAEGTLMRNVSDLSSTPLRQRVLREIAGDAHSASAASCSGNCET
jgi:L-lactate dehydrogenase (cytochrome)